MNLPTAISTVVGLGLLGLDPFGALIVISSIATGVRRRVVIVFFATALVSTVLTGFLLDESVQHINAWITSTFTVTPSVRATVQLLATVGLGLWTAHAWKHRNQQRKDSKATVLAGASGMVLLGIFWGVSAITDPSFYGITALSAASESIAFAVAAFTGWFLVSQAPLTLVVLTLAAGKNSSAVRRAISLAQATAKPARYTLAILLAIATVALALNTLTYVANGTFWPL